MIWRWLRQDVVVAVHDEQIAEHGGSPGLRDAGLLSSALARPQNRVAYGKPSVFDLAAAYAAGIILNPLNLCYNVKKRQTVSKAEGIKPVS